VAGGSHCADMGPPDPETDSPSMLSAKLSKAAVIQRWLAEQPDGGEQEQTQPMDDERVRRIKSDDVVAAKFPACFQDLAALHSSWLVQANADYDHKMTEEKCFQLCTAKKVLPLIALQVRKTTNKTMLVLTRT
jgi:hypothetical protein